MVKLLKIIVFMLFSLRAMAEVCPTDRKDYFCVTPDMAPDSKIQVFDFFNTPYQISALFEKELSAQRKTLHIDAQWESPYFGAGISFYNDIYRLMILGGTTRVPDMTVNAYVALICHELGHLLGGLPYQTIPHAQWSSSEGQADFFAASVCLPKYFAKTLSVEDQKKIPAKIEKAGFEMMWAFRKFDSSGSSSKLIRYKKDETKVSETLINLYPSIQCRYENFRNPSTRPACWFKK
ncbi:MAG: hypothetical protein K2Q18_00300 [Bdellovibrionales bacterium]|nr:hypothetical protein [Bdellovibrionales bacterium]